MKRPLLARALGLVVTLMGVLVLVGWTWDIAPLKSVVTGAISMKVNTALGMLFCGTALLVLTRSKMGKWARGSITVLAGAVIALGALTLGEYLAGWDLHIDEAIFRDPAPANPGRMSPVTALNFILTGSALVLAARVTGGRWQHAVSAALAAAAGVIGAVALTGSLLSMAADYRWWDYTGVALHTAVGFVLLGGGLLAWLVAAGNLRWALDGRTTAGVVLAVTLMVTMAGISFGYGRRLQDLDASVTRTHRVLAGIQKVGTDVMAMQSAQRAYLLSGDPHLLDQSTEAARALVSNLEILEGLVAGNFPQQRRAEQLMPVIEREMEVADRIAAICQQQGLAAARQEILAEPGIARAEEIKARLREMADEESNLLREWEVRSGPLATTAFLLLPLGVFSCLALLLLGVSLLNSGFAARDVAEEEHRELAQLIEHSRDFIAMADLNGRITFMNSAARRMIGVSHDKDSGSLQFTDYVPEEWQKFFHETVIRTAREEGLWEGEMQLKNIQTGALVDVVRSTFLLRDAMGQPHSFATVTRDITEGKRAELALREKEAQLHAADRRLAEIVHGMTEACFALDTGWRFTFINDRSETLLRTPRQEMIGQTIWELFPKLIDTPIETNYRRAMTERVPVAFEVFSPLADRWLDIRLFPTAEGLAAFLLDIDARRKSEEALRASEDQFRTMANSIPQLAWMARANGFIFWYNQRWHDYTGLRREDVEGWGWQSVHHPDTLPNVLATWKESIATGQPFEMEFPLLGADRKYRMFLTRVQPLRDAQGQVVQWFGTNTDVDELKRMEESLRLTQTRLNSTLAAGAVGTWTWDIVNDRLFADEFAAKVFLIEPDAAAEGVPAGDYLRAVVEEDQPAVSGEWSRAIRSCGDYDIEYRVRRQDGGLRWIQARGRVEGNAAGKAVHFHGAVMDVTERKHTENRFRRLVESNAQGVIFWNRNGEISDANDAFLDLVGYTREDLEAGRVDWAAMTPPEFAHLDQRALEELAAKGICSPLEKEYFRKDGSRVQVLLGAAVFEDEPDEGVCFTLDISERKRTDQILRESEEHFRFLNDLSEATRNLADPEQIMVATARMLGTHLRASRCAYADVAADSEQFTILHDYTDGCASTVGNYQLSLFGVRSVATLLSGRTLIIRDVRKELAAEDGAETFLAIGIQAIITCPLVKDGSLRAMMAVHQTEPRDWRPGEIAIVQDVVERCWATIERRTAEEKIRLLNADLERRVAERTAQLLTANQELEAFSYSVSHDLRTPLRAVDGFSRAVQEDYGALLPPEGQRYLRTIRESAQRMGVLIDDLLTFSRLSRLPITRQKVDAWQQAQGALDELMLEYAGRAIEIRLASLPPCEGDPALLRQVWINLLSNALKYTGKRESTLLEIGAREEQGNTVYFVRDNGTGFDMRYAGKLFGVFQRLHRQEEFAGTGVGLAIVQRIIHRHGGRIWAEASVDQGATFHFTLTEETKT